MPKTRATITTPVTSIRSTGKKAKSNKATAKSATKTRTDEANNMTPKTLVASKSDFPITFGRTPKSSYEGKFLDMLKVQFGFVEQMEKHTITNKDMKAYCDVALAAHKHLIQIMFSLHDKTKEMRSGPNVGQAGFLNLHPDRYTHFRTWDKLIETVDNEADDKKRKIKQESTTDDVDDLLGSDDSETAGMTENDEVLDKQMIEQRKSWFKEGVITDEIGIAPIDESQPPNDEDNKNNYATLCKGKRGDVKKALASFKNTLDLYGAAIVKKTNQVFKSKDDHICYVKGLMSAFKDENERNAIKAAMKEHDFTITQLLVATDENEDEEQDSKRQKTEEELASMF